MKENSLKIFLCLNMLLYLSNCTKFDDTRLQLEIVKPNIMATNFILDAEPKIKIFKKNSVEYNNPYVAEDAKNIKASGVIKNYKKEGLWIYKSDFDIPICEGHYKEDIKEGLWQFYGKENSYQGNYENGNKIGIWKIYTHDGNIFKMINFGINVMDGQYLEFDKDSSMIASGIYKQGLKNGYWKEVNKTYLLLSEGNYLMGYKDGYWKETSEDGTIINDGNYKNGNKQGYWKEIHVVENNRYEQENGDYCNNVRCGWWQFFDSQNRLKEEGHFVNGKKMGYVKIYREGVLFEEGELFDGKRIGSWSTFDRYGKLTSLVENGE